MEGEPETVVRPKTVAWALKMLVRASSAPTQGPHPQAAKMKTATATDSAPIAWAQIATTPTHGVILGSLRIDPFVTPTTTPTATPTISPFAMGSTTIAMA